MLIQTYKIGRFNRGRGEKWRSSSRNCRHETLPANDPWSEDRSDQVDSGRQRDSNACEIRKRVQWCHSRVDNKLRRNMSEPNLWHKGTRFGTSSSPPRVVANKTPTFPLSPLATVLTMLPLVVLLLVPIRTNTWDSLTPYESQESFFVLCAIK